MDFTIGDIEKGVRLKILDTYEDNYRFSPSEIFSAMRDGMKIIRSLRPESKYVNGLLTDSMLVINNVDSDFYVPFSFPATISSVSYTLAQYRDFKIKMEDRWMECLVYYVIHQMYLKDDTDTSNAQLAASYYSKFLENLKS